MSDKRWIDEEKLKDAVAHTWGILNQHTIRYERLLIIIDQLAKPAEEPKTDAIQECIEAYEDFVRSENDRALPDNHANRIESALAQLAALKGRKG